MNLKQRFELIQKNIRKAYVIKRKSLKQIKELHFM